MRDPFSVLDQVRDVRMIGFNTSTIAAGIAASAEILQVRWNPTIDTSARLAIFGLEASANVETTGFTAGQARFNVLKASGWTADGSGGSALTLTGNNGQLDSAEPEHDVPGVRIATTAALGAGTKSNGSIPLFSNTHVLTNAVNEVVIPRGTQLLPQAILSRRPVILNFQEGLIVTCTVPGTGTWRFAGSLIWGVIRP